MALVKVHRASDGSIHETAKLCSQHERKLKLIKDVEATSFNMAAFWTNEDAGSNERVLSEADLDRFIVENAEVLRALLK